MLAEVPGAAVASDQDYRKADLAIDFCEDVPPLPEADVGRIVAIFEAAGAQAKVSSIHVNGWFGDYDKLTMTQTLFQREFGADVATLLDRHAFVHRRLAQRRAHVRLLPDPVVVANIQSQLHRLQRRPACGGRATPWRGLRRDGRTAAGRPRLTLTLETAVATTPKPPRNPRPRPPRAAAPTAAASSPSRSACRCWPRWWTPASR